MGRMIFESKVVLAFDETNVAAASLSRGPRGVKITARARAPLPPGALLAGPLEDNIVRPQEVKEALQRVHGELGSNGRRAELVLPDGVARLLLLEVPPGVRGDEFARYRLPQGLPFAASEALVDGVAAPPGRFLAAAVRRSVVRGYEAVAAAAGFAQERVDLLPLRALGPLLRGAERRLSALAVVLSDAAFSLAYFEAGQLAFFRNRRRDVGYDEYARLRDEIARTAALAGAPAQPPVVVLGAEAPHLATALAEEGFTASAGYPGGARADDWLVAASA
jgi:Tfp pilus assembly PilM family ATPase